MTRRLSQIGKALLFVAVAAFMVSESMAAELPGKGTTVRPIKGTSASSWFQHIVVQIGLERLGYEVAEHEITKFPALHLALGNGDVDYTAHHWNPLHIAFYEKSGGESKMTRLGHLITGALQGYLVDKATAEKHGITNIDQMKDPEIAKLFDTDGDGKANLAGCDPGWGCERVIEHHLDAYKLRDSINHDQGSYFAIIADTVARQKKGEPIFYYTWTPLWLGNVIVPGKDSVWLNVPFSSLPDNRDADTTMPDGKNSGFEVNEIIIVANNAFLAENPAAKRFFELVEIPIADVNAQNLRQHNGEKTPEDLQRHAEEWIAANKTKFDSWIAEAVKAAM